MDTLSTEERSERMRRVKSKDTRPEKIVRSMVHGMGFRYRLHDRSLPGKPDLVFKGRRKVIFVHGCFWHRHPSEKCRLTRTPKSRIRFWKKKFAQNVERDFEVRELLGEMGWDFLIVWECELQNRVSLGKNLANFLS